MESCATFKELLTFQHFWVWITTAIHLLKTILITEMSFKNCHGVICKEVMNDYWGFTTICVESQHLAIIIQKLFLRLNTDST